MKHCFAVGVACLSLTAISVAQVHGVPASVTSPRSGGTVLQPRGIPSFVGSLGPEGLGYPSVNFSPTSPPRRDRLGRVVLRTPIPLFYGVPYYPVYVPVQEVIVEPQQRAERNVRNEPQKIIVEIRDTRPPTPAATPAAPETKAAPREEVERPRVATVFVFQDGSRKELKDFAITQTELIDLSEGAIRRTPLTALDRPATVKANVEHGVELHFPVASSD